MLRHVTQLLFLALFYRFASRLPSSLPRSSALTKQHPPTNDMAIKRPHSSTPVKAVTAASTIKLEQQTTEPRNDTTVKECQANAEPVKLSSHYVAIEIPGTGDWVAHRWNEENIICSVRSGHIKNGTRATAAEDERRFFLATLRKHWANGLWVEVDEMLGVQFFGEEITRSVWQGLAELSQRVSAESAAQLLNVTTSGRVKRQLTTEDVHTVLLSLEA